MEGVSKGLRRSQGPKVEHSRPLPSGAGLEKGHGRDGQDPRGEVGEGQVLLKTLQGITFKV